VPLTNNTVTLEVYGTYPFFADTDGDTYGAGGEVLLCAVDAATPPAGYVLNNTDCDNNNAEIYQSNSLYVDADNDGYTSGATAVVCYGAAVPSGYIGSLTAIDCNDQIAAVNPGQGEVLYNGVDDNCDGNKDEGNQLTSQVVASQCGTTVQSMSTLIQVQNYSQITKYRFIVTNTTTGVTQTLEKAQPYFTFSQLASYDYATTYSISVELQRNNVWLGYTGEACQVSTPAILSEGGSAQITQCGQTLQSINTLIVTASLPGVTGYRFRITNLSDPSAPNQVQTIDRGHISWFKLSMLASFNYGTTYKVEVAVKTTGDYSAFGSPCSVTAPLVPTLSNCGATIATSGSLVTAPSMQYATSYRFEITNMSTNQVTTIDRPSSYFTFNQVPGYSPSTQYGVRVSVMTKGHFSGYGDACEITSPGAAARFEVAPKTENAFAAIAYPNPFADNFSIDVTTSLTETITVNMYDMTGRLLETREVAPSEVKALELGDRYPSGVYNVIVTQGENVKTLRVIKR
jgi:hypothetical protein